MSNCIKVISYNIHAGIGMDGILKLDRIADIIQSENADIVGLNEVDRCTCRSRGVDQVRYIADKLGYHYIFGKAIDFSGGEYGNAFLSKYPIASVKNHRLPIHKFKTNEPRAMLECDVILKGHAITVFVTHLGLEKAERELSIEYIIGILKEKHNDTILLGDFNISFHDGFVELSPLVKVLKDTAKDSGKAGEIMTFSSTNPSTKIDYIFASKHATVLSTYTLSSLASDHLPLVCEMDFQGSK